MYLKTYLSEGIVYGSEPQEMIKILKIKILPDFVMLVTFSNGKTRLFDANVLDGEVYKPLGDHKVFENTVIDHGVVTWLDGKIDCAPEYMYAHSYEYPSAVSL